MSEQAAAEPPTSPETPTTSNVDSTGADDEAGEGGVSKKAAKKVRSKTHSSSRPPCPVRSLPHTQYPSITLPSPGVIPSTHALHGVNTPPPASSIQIALDIVNPRTGERPARAHTATTSTTPRRRAQLPPPRSFCFSHGELTRKKKRSRLFPSFPFFRSDTV